MEQFNYKEFNEDRLFNGFSGVLFCFSGVAGLLMTNNPVFLAVLAVGGFFVGVACVDKKLLKKLETEYEKTGLEVFK